MEEYLSKLMSGKVLKEVGSDYLYMRDGDKIWLLHSADKRVFKATYYHIDTFTLPDKPYVILPKDSISVD